MSSPLTWWRRLRPETQAVIVVAVITAIVGPIVVDRLSSEGGDDDEELSAEAEITSLDAGEIVDDPTPTLSGTADGPDDDRLWIVVWSDSLGLYFPQEGPLDVRDRRWFTEIHVGDDTTEPDELFRIFVVWVESDDTQHEFQEFGTCERRGACPEYRDFPAGASELDSVEVFRS